MVRRFGRSLGIQLRLLIAFLRIHLSRHPGFGRVRYDLREDRVRAETKCGKDCYKKNGAGSRPHRIARTSTPTFRLFQFRSVVRTGAPSWSPRAMQARSPIAMPGTRGTVHRTWLGALSLNGYSL